MTANVFFVIKLKKCQAIMFFFIKFIYNSEARNLKNNEALFDLEVWKKVCSLFSSSYVQYDIDWMPQEQMVCHTLRKKK